MATVDRLVWDYHKAPEKDKSKIEKKIAEHHFQISDTGDRYVLKCTNPINKEIGYNADTFIDKVGLEERFKNLN
jgi:hypothetical protein